MFSLSTELQGRSIAFLVAPEGVEQIELTEPWKAVEETGPGTLVTSRKPDDLKAFCRAAVEAFAAPAPR